MVVKIRAFGRLLGRAVMTSSFVWAVSLLVAVTVVIAARLFIPENSLVLRIFVTLYLINTGLAFLVSRELPTIQKVMLVTNLLIAFLALGYYVLIAVSLP